MTPWLGTVLKAGVTFGLLFFLGTRVELATSLDLLTRASIAAFFSVIVVLTLQVSIAIFRWHLLMTSREMDISIGRSACYFWMGLFFNQLLPSSIGGDAVRGYCLVRQGQSLALATLTILLDRIIAMVGLLMLILMVIPYALHFIDARELHWSIGLALLLLTVGLALVVFMGPFTRGFRSWIVVRGLSTLSDSVRQLLRSRLGLGLTLLSVTIHVLSVVAVGMLASAIHIEVAWLTLGVIVPIMTLLALVPISIAGWGVREGVMVMGLGYAGIGAEQALALSILYGLSLLAVALPGGLVWLVAPGGRSFGGRQVSEREIQ